MNLKVLRSYNIGNYTIIYINEIGDPLSLIHTIETEPYVSGLGRGRIKFISHEGQNLVVRQYLHGGLLRGITGDRYISSKRVINEISVLLYLKTKGFPCPEPYCALIKNGFGSKRLFLITKKIDNAVPFSQILKETKGNRRARQILALACLVTRLFKLGVIHADLHLSNVLVANNNELFIVDFDRAKIKNRIKKRDFLKILFRLYRYARALEKKGEFLLTDKEKLLFLRACSSILGYDIIDPVIKRIKKVELIQEIGWFIESKIYGGKK
ncbi:MAG: AarF/UbiB family protein [Deltaproteobacteria bacterium]|nr:AarF/UbiB family protein [Deltaproteobacteria bacterium]